MDAAMKVAAAGLSREADRAVFQLYRDHSNILSLDNAGSYNIINFLIDARQSLYEAGVFDQNEVVLEVSPAVASILYKAELDKLSSNNDLMEHGCIGSIAGCKVFVSNNIALEDNHHMCFMRTKRAIAFAEQISEVEAYRPERRFADALKGLHLFGTAVVYPEELVVLSIQPDPNY